MATSPSAKPEQIQLATEYCAPQVGFLFVLPQVVGFAATRIGRRASAIIWALAAAGTTALLGGMSAAYRNQEHDPTPMSLGSFWIGIAAISVLHFAVGSILGVLDQRAQARMRVVR